MSKGSSRRPAQVDDRTVESNWELAFGTTKPVPAKPKPGRIIIAGVDWGAMPTDEEIRKMAAVNLEAEALFRRDYSGE